MDGGDQSRKHRPLSLRRANHHRETAGWVLVKRNVKRRQGFRIQRTFFDVTHDTDDFHRGLRPVAIEHLFAKGVFAGEVLFRQRPVDDDHARL